MIIHFTTEESIFLVIVYSSTREILKSHINDCCKINNKQMIKIHKKSEHLRFKYSKIKSPLIVFAHFESILLQKDKGKQNLDDSYINKYEKHAACSYWFELVCAGKFSHINLAF